MRRQQAPVARLLRGDGGHLDTRSPVMRSLTYIVLGFMPVFASAAFAEALNIGMKEGIIVQAQAGGQVNGQTGQAGPAGSMERMNDQGKTKEPMSYDKAKEQGAYPARGRDAGQDPARDGSSSQARKPKKDLPKDSGG
jgi:hypothetical protein